jgi:hypothetical protein
VRPGVPPYGKDFRLKDTGYHPVFASRVYVLKRDPRWFIRSDKTSKTWRIYHGPSFDTSPVMGTPLPRFKQAMDRLLAGIDQGFYQTEGGST